MLLEGLLRTTGHVSRISKEGREARGSRLESGYDDHDGNEGDVDAVTKMNCRIRKMC